MTKPDDYLWDGSGDADPDVAKLEELLRPLAHDRPMDEVRMRRARRRRAPWIMAGIAAIAAAAVLVLVLRRGDVPGTTGCAVSGEGFAFHATGDGVSCNGASLDEGVLRVGGVLDTGTSNVRLAIADIGSADLSPQTRVRLSRSEAGERHELHLERGKMHAKVDAPPRIFAVTTPSTSVVDLGCEYEIDIDDTGAGSIVVMSGMVELASDANAVVVAPAGTEARLLAGRKPSLPVASTASAELRAAVTAFEQSGAIDGVLASATEADAITIVNLAVLRADLRPRVLARLAELVPPPEGVTIESAAAKPADLARWSEDIVTLHFGDRVLREMMQDE
ncbi:MAG: FecR domain-containing protein [Kofleriaceae bacterium]